jgi:hypothetical protein
MARKAKAPERVYVWLDEPHNKPIDVETRRPTRKTETFFGWKSTWHEYRLVKPARKKVRRA